jgi:CBS domain-containing protein
MKVHDIMTQPPHTCRLETDLATASRRMKDFDCGFLPVLDQHGRVVGVLTDRDIAIAVGDRRRSASHVTAREAMSSTVHTCLPDEDIHRVLNRMATRHLRRLPVVTADDDLMGVVSIDDIILWGVEHGGVSAKELAGALRSICRPKDATSEDVLSGLLDK